MKKALITIPLTILATLAVAGTAEAHNATASGSCQQGVTWSATNYEQQQTNSIVVRVDGQIRYQDADFKASDTGNIATDKTIAHTWQVVVNAPGTEYDRNLSGNYPACVVPTTTTVAPTTTVVTTTTVALIPLIEVNADCASGLTIITSGYPNGSTGWFTIGSEPPRTFPLNGTFHTDWPLSIDVFDYVVMPVPGDGQTVTGTVDCTPTTTTSVVEVGEPPVPSTAPPSTVVYADVLLVEPSLPVTGTNDTLIYGAALLVFAGLVLLGVRRRV